jgi:hypothetical protein
MHAVIYQTIYTEHFIYAYVTIEYTRQTKAKELGSKFIKKEELPHTRLSICAFPHIRTVL